jgi:hypothetical protein
LWQKQIAMYSSPTALYALISAYMAVFVVLLLIALGVRILYILTLQNTLKQVTPQNRKMEPGQAWLLLIPLFNIVWEFITVNNVSESVGNELRSRGVPDVPKPAYGVGLAYCILNICFFIPFAPLAGLICFIVYWVKVSGYQSKLKSLPPASQESVVF